MKEIFQAMKEDSKNRREHNRNSAPGHLESSGIPFQARNSGAHLIVEGAHGFIDFWPGTGKWIGRINKIKGFGVKNLIKAIKRRRVL